LTVNSVGNLTGLTERTSPTTTVARTYQYDGLDRLTAQKNGATTVEGFTYDATGNRLSKTGGTTATYTYGASNHRLSSVGGISRTYNTAGETTALGNGKTFTYTDDHRLLNVLAQAKLQMSNVYNARGERIGKSVTKAGGGVANSRQFVYDSAGHLLGEYTAAGARVKEYVWIEDVLVAVLGTFDASTYQFVEADQLGTPRAVIHPTKNVIVWRWDLNPTAFGGHLPNGNPDGDSLTYDLNLRFPGQYYDAESGLNYNRFRDYDPSVGRYLQSDPVGLQAGPSTYSYVDSAPLQAVDPTGLTKWSGHLEIGTGGYSIKIKKVPVADIFKAGWANVTLTSKCAAGEDKATVVTLTGKAEVDDSNVLSPFNAGFYQVEVRDWEPVATPSVLEGPFAMTENGWWWDQSGNVKIGAAAGTLTGKAWSGIDAQGNLSILGVPYQDDCNCKSK
jgi:RHS repeat-associated protein